MPDDLLSQNEIDALFNELARSSDLPVEAKQERFRSVRPYDFRHPSKLSKDQLRTMQMIFEGYARLVSTSLSGLLRSQVHVALVSIEQTVFDDYVRALAQRTLLNLASAEPLPNTFVIEYDLDTAFLMVDRLLGGLGKMLQAQDRTVTDIEETLLQSVSTVFLDAMSEAWAHIAPIEARLQRLEYSPRYLQIAPLNEPVVLLLFDMRLHERQTTMSLCIPYSVIEPVASELNMQMLFTTARDESAEAGNDGQLRLQRVTIPLAAILGATELPVAVVNDLRVGDVVRLDGLATDPLIVSVNKKPTYVARPGVVRHNVAVQVVGVLQEGEE
jgi:flagellar motor switch protein FliM